jgi:hypothetical protein
MLSPVLGVSHPNPHLPRIIPGLLRNTATSWFRRRVVGVSEMTSPQITTPDLSDLTPGWWWLQIQPSGEPMGWVHVRVFLPETGPYIVAVGGDGHSRTHGLVEAPAGLDLDLGAARVPVYAASPILHPEAETLLRRQLGNAIRTYEATQVVLTASLAATALDDFLDETAP